METIKESKALQGFWECTIALTQAARTKDIPIGVIALSLSYHY